jgi:hypothetical protein
MFLGPGSRAAMGSEPASWASRGAGGEAIGTWGSLPILRVHALMRVSVYLVYVVPPTRRRARARVCARNGGWRADMHQIHRYTRQSHR